MKKLLLFASILLSTWPCFAQSKSFLFGETKRKYLIYLPASYQPNKNYPLIYNFHGGGMTAVEQMFYSRMNQTADKHEFIAVYPSGIKADWNVGFEMSYKTGTDDVAFIKALTDTLKKNYSIDEKAIYATGLSRGGFFCHRLAAELPDVFAAVSSVGGPIPDSVKYYHHSKVRISVMQVHGTLDEVVKFGGKPAAYSSAPATFNYWKSHNGLSTNLTHKKVFNGNKKDGTSAILEEVSDGRNSVSLITIKNGGHTWPGSDPFNIGYPLGKTTLDIDINEIMWNFFHGNRKQ